LHEVSRCIKLGNLASGQDHDTIRVDDRVDAVRDGDDGAILERSAPECRLEQCIGLDVDGRLWLMLVPVAKCRKTTGNPQTGESCWSAT
jgi:hypothetical protein